MRQSNKIIQVLLVLSGCMCMCFGLVLAAFEVPGLANSADLQSAAPLAGYLLLAAAGVGLMAAAKLWFS